MTKVPIPFNQISCTNGIYIDASDVFAMLNHHVCTQLQHTTSQPLGAAARRVATSVSDISAPVMTTLVNEPVESTVSEQCAHDLAYDSGTSQLCQSMHGSHKQSKDVCEIQGEDGVRSDRERQAY